MWLSRPCRLLTPLEALIQVGLQHNRIVVLKVARAEQQGHVSVFGCFKQ
jgi:hypothetical protein